VRIVEKPFPARQKDHSVETLRGLTIILVVLYHANGGLVVPENSLLSHLNFTFQYLRMPLFTVISGWVYALRPASFGGWDNFTIKKARRLLLPLPVIGVLYFLVRFATAGNRGPDMLTDIWRIVLSPFPPHLWYLPALFVVFLLVSLIDSLRGAEKIWLWGAWTAFFFVVLFFLKSFVPESVPYLQTYKNAVYLAPFFLMGVGLRRFSEEFAGHGFKVLTRVVFVVMLVFQQFKWYKVMDFQLISDAALGLFIGGIGSIVLINLKWNVRWLRWMGGYSYTIYLFHVFFLGAARFLHDNLGIRWPAAVILICLAGGLFGPVLIDRIADRFSITRLALLGRGGSPGAK
jgi:peptidoglycan/LPS O-acetylase OafA/YrhL